MAPGEEGHGMDLMAMWTMTFASPSNKSDSEAPASAGTEAAPETPAVPATGSSDAGASDLGSDVGTGAEIAPPTTADAGSAAAAAKPSCKRKRRARKA